MGSVFGTLEEVVDVMTAQGKKVGVLEVHLFRPFSAKHMLSELAGDRSASGGSGPHQGARCLCEPLYLDVAAVLSDAGRTDTG